MKIVVSGSSGFIGSALVPALRQAGHEVRRLVRRAAAAPDEVAWNPAVGDIDRSRLEGIDAVINLAGENLSSGRWTPARRARIRLSRVDATRTLVDAATRLTWKPAVWLNASAVGFYGDRGNEVLTEASAGGAGFLPEVCREWEAHAEDMRRTGARVGLLRFGLVLDRQGGALAHMLPLFRLGLGGRLGSGHQWMSWVAREDVVGVFMQALTDRRYAGPINVVAPQAVTNAEFTRTLASVLRRRAVLSVPRWALRLAFGRGLADEALLASIRAEPARLRQWDYPFRALTLEKALRAIL